MIRRTKETIAFDDALGRRIAVTRKALGMKAKNLAKSAGISDARLYGYETGRVGCPPVILSKLSAALGVSVNALVPKLTTCCFLEDSPKKSLQTR
jgi:transcriptional regulator with XRE-family HTH domain